MGFVGHSVFGNITNIRLPLSCAHLQHFMYYRYFLKQLLRDNQGPFISKALFFFSQSNLNCRAGMKIECYPYTTAITWLLLIYVHKIDVMTQ